MGMGVSTGHHPTLLPHGTMARVPYWLWGHHGEGQETARMHSFKGGDSPAGRGTSPGGPWSPSSPQPAAARSCPPAGVGEGRALSGMPVWLSESTALGANSLQLGFESVHPAGAD